MSAPDTEPTPDSESGEAAVKAMAYDPFSWPYLFLGAALLVGILALPAKLARDAGYETAADALAAGAIALFARAVWEVFRKIHGVSRAFVFTGWALSTVGVALMDACTSLS